MNYVALMKDLTESTEKCCFCRKPLTSLKAYILQNKCTDRIVYAGPICASKKIGDPSLLSGIPDFTRHTQAASQSDRGGAGGGAGGTFVVDTKRNAKEYLILREDKLAEELNCSYSVLKQYYEQSKMRELTNKELKHINNIEAKAPKNLKLSTLQKIYNYLFWINIAIEKLSPENRQFLEGVRIDIMNKGRITKKQEAGVNKWLKNIAGVPQVK